MTDVPPKGALAGDVLNGAGDIAEFIYGDPKYRRRVYHLTEKGVLPTFRLGSVVCARRSVLLQWIADQERGALKRAEAA